MKALAAAILLLTLGCAVEHVDRARWSQMSVDDRTLYVQTLIGEEQAKDAKGGAGRTVSRTPAQYVAAIDAAYARGDARTPSEIFGEIVE